MSWRLAIILVAVVVALYALHRLALWAEERGWIYYRRRAGRGTLGSAFLEVQSLIEPGQHHVLEVMREEQVEEDDSGDPPSPDDDADAPPPSP